MPFISSQRVKEIREQIKKEFPQFKFSITNRDHSMVCVSILSGTIDFGTEYQQVNHFYIERNFQGEAQKMLMRIKEIMNKGNGVEVEDGDYGTVPHFYLHLSIGEWDRKYQLIEKAETTQPIISAEGIEIVEYSERAIAVFGNTKPIKEVLKSIGGKFNPFLTHNGTKEPGWIFPKTKQAELNTLIA